MLYPFARLWWRLRRPPHEGALVALYVGSAVLLVRASYRVRWSLPGGGVRPGETPEAAARRELDEEIGLAAPALHPAGVLCGTWDGRPERVHFFELRIAQLPKLRLDNREIVAARLADPVDLGAARLTGPVADYFSRVRS